MIKFTHSIGAKMAVTALAAVVVIMGAGLAMVSWRIWRAADADAREQSRIYVEQTVNTLAAYNEGAREQAAQDFHYFRQRLAGKFRLDAGGTEPVMLLDERPLNGQFDLVDGFTRDSKGGVATIFARDGDDYLRITTSLLNGKGERAFKTKLDRKHPAFALMGEGKTYIGRATLFGKDYMTVYEPIRVDGQTIGILFTGSEMTNLLKRAGANLLQLKHGETGAVYAVDTRPGPTHGRFFGMRDGVSPLNLETAEGKAWMERILAVKSVTTFEDLDSPLEPGAGRRERLVVVGRFEPWGLAIVADAPRDELMASASFTLKILWASLVAGVGVLMAVLLYAARRVVARPLGRLRTAVTALAAGDVSKPIERIADDEIGDLGLHMEQFRAMLAGSLRSVRDGASQVTLASHEIAQGNQDLSSRTEAQASAIEQTASAMEQMAQTVRQNADNARAANTLAVAAVEVAQQGGAVVCEVVQTMRAIDDSGKRIADITALIDSIAFQTNILALNAAVEAARAGEQGRGFAVVASEVRSLAQRSAQAAGQIKGLIGESVERIADGSQLVDRAGVTMLEVVESVRRVTRLVGEISTASDEQSAGIAQIGAAVSQMDKSTQQNAALVEEVAAAGGSLRSQAQSLDRSIAAFQL